MIGPDRDVPVDLGSVIAGPPRARRDTSAETTPVPPPAGSSQPAEVAQPADVAQPAEVPQPATATEAGADPAPAEPADADLSPAHATPAEPAAAALAATRAAPSATAPPAETAPAPAPHAATSAADRSAAQADTPAAGQPADEAQGLPLAAPDQDDALPAMPAGTRADAEAEDETEAGPDADGGPGSAALTPGPRRRRGRVPVLLALLGVLAVCLAAVGGVLTARDVRAAQLDAVLDPSGAAVNAAREGARELLSYDYRTLPKDRQQAKDLGTPAFADKYQKFLDAAVKDAATQVNGVVTAEVSEAAAGSCTTTNRAYVLLFVNQSTTRQGLAGPRVDGNRVRATMLKQGGRWLVDNLEDPSVAMQPTC